MTEVYVGWCFQAHRISKLHQVKEHLLCMFGFEEGGHKCTTLQRRVDLNAYEEYAMIVKTEGRIV